ncbi:hypothetical protein GQ42DRAFT_104495, partial [Ramicandelaber brevisporus]
MPTEYHQANSYHLANLVSDMLVRLAAHNDRLPITSEGLTRFHSRSKPKISVHEYLARIVRFANLEPCCILAIIVYIDRASVAPQQSQFSITSLTVHRFLITACSIAAKAHCDSYGAASVYGTIGGVGVLELNAMEVELARLLQWRMVCRQEELIMYYSSMVNQHPRYNQL